MAENRLEFHGGVYPAAGPGNQLKFLLFLVGNGKELSFYEARKMGLIQHPRSTSLAAMNMSEYITDFPVAKLFVQEQIMGQPSFVYSFYWLLGRNSDRQIVEVKPKSPLLRAAGYRFKAEAKSLKRTEALQLFDKNSLSYKMLYCQKTPPVDILRQMVTITKPKVVQREQRVRRLRNIG